MDGLERQSKSDITRIVRFFDRKDSYSLYGDDAKLVAQEYYHTLAALKKIGREGSTLSTISVTKAMFESMLMDLLMEKNFNVEVWASIGGGWRISKRGSPGNIQDFEDTLTQSYGNTQQPIVVSVKLVERKESIHVGIAYADVTKREFGSTEFIDNGSLTTLESVLLQVGARECVIEETKKSGGINSLESLLMMCNIKMTPRPRSEFHTRDIEQDMKTLIGDIKFNLEFPEQLDQKLALECLAATVKYLDLLADDTNLEMYAWTEFAVSRYMRMDYAALKAMNVFPVSGESQAATELTKARSSLFGLLNQCKTAMGSRHLYRWLKQPLLDVEAINARLDVVSQFVKDTTLRSTVRLEFLRGAPDCYRLSKKFQRRRARLEDCVRVYELLLKLPNLISSLELSADDVPGSGASEVLSRYAKPLREVELTFKGYLAMVETTIDLSDASAHRYYIAAEFDAELRELREMKEKLLLQMENHFATIVSDLGPKAHAKLERSDMHGYHVRISRKDEKHIRGRSDFIILETRNNGVKFVSSSLRDLSRSFELAIASYEEKQSSVVAKVMDVAISYSKPLVLLGEILSEIDVLSSFAEVAFSSAAPFTRPTLTENGSQHRQEGQITLRGCRHPCIELAEDVEFIPNDVSLRKGSVEFVIITGPNMGGKSTFIRQTAISVLLAQIGCFVPCDSATVSIHDQILCRMGAGDSLQRGVSTFMAEMLETAAIIKSATANSLVLIDELGRGTSTYDGFGLAWAISMHLAQETKCFTFFATHFHELTEIAQHVQTIRNFHVTMRISNPDTSNERSNDVAFYDSTGSGDSLLTLLYKVKEGSCDQSFGIHVAEIAKFPSKVVESAKLKLRELESFNTSVEINTNDGEELEGKGKKRRKLEENTARKEEEKERVEGVLEGEKNIIVERSVAIRKLLLEFKDFPLEKLSAEEVKELFNGLKEKYGIN